MIIGLEQSTNPELAPLPKRHQRYSEEVWSVLKRHYPIDRSDSADHALAIWQSLNAFAEALCLLPADVRYIEAEITQKFERQLETYQQCAVDLLLKEYPNSPDLFSQLCSQFDLSESVAVSLETAAREIAEQCRANYQSRFSAAIDKYGLPLNAEIKKGLHLIGQQMGFSASALESLEIEVKNLLWQRQASYRLRYISEIYRDGMPDVAALKQLQKDLKLSDRIVNAVETQEMHRYQQRTQQYQEALTQIIYQSATFNLDALKPLQQKIGLGDKLVEKITTTLMARCHADRKRYRDAFMEAIHQHGDLSLSIKNDLQQLGQSFGLGSALIDAIERECRNQLAERKQIHRNSFKPAIYPSAPPAPGNSEGLITLQQQLGSNERLVDDRLAQEGDTPQHDSQDQLPLPMAISASALLSDDANVLKAKAKSALRRGRQQTIHLPILGKTGQLRRQQRLATSTLVLLVGMAGVWAIGQRPRQSDQTLAKIEALSQAKAAKKPESLTKAIAGVQRVPPNSPMFSHTPQMTEHSETQLLQKASAKYEQGNFAAALQSLKSIPNSSSRSGKAKAMIAKFTQHWQANQIAFAQVKQAHQEQKWATVIHEHQKIDHQHLKKQALPFVQAAALNLVRQQPQPANAISSNPSSGDRPAFIQAAPSYAARADKAPAHQAPAHQAHAYQALPRPAYTPPPQDSPPSAALQTAPPEEEVL